MLFEETLHSWAFQPNVQSSIQILNETRVSNSHHNILGQWEMMLEKHPWATQRLKHIANDLTDGKISKQIIVPQDVQIVHGVHFKSQGPKKKTKESHSSPFILNIVIVYIFTSFIYPFQYLHDNWTGALGTYFITQINTCKFLKGRCGQTGIQWHRGADLHRKMKLSGPLYEPPPCDYCPQRLACQQNTTAARQKQTKSAILVQNPPLGGGGGEY